MDSTTIDEHQSAIVKGIILQMLHTPPAIETQDGKLYIYWPFDLASLNSASTNFWCMGVIDDSNCNQFVGRELPPVLVFANKCDKPLVPCPSQIAQMLDLPGETFSLPRCCYYYTNNSYTRNIGRGRPKYPFRWRAKQMACAAVLRLRWPWSASR